MAIPPPPRVPQPQVNRDELMVKLGIRPPKEKKIDRSQIPSFSTPSAPPMPVMATPDPTFVKPKPKGGGIFDIPVIGPMIDLIDTPRAIAVSTIKEVGDLFAGDGFSPTDWWNQAEDNMMMGEVLRDWGVDLGGWNLALGLIGDVALDPLTYLLPSAFARYAKSDDVANALFNASKAAGKAKDTAKANMLATAGNQVKKSGAIHAAGQEALEEIGMTTGLRFTVFGTGKLSKQIVEKPLRRMFPKLGEALDLRRIEQLPQVGEAGRKIKNTSKFWRWGDEAIEGGPRFRQSVDWSNPDHKAQIINQARRIREGKNLVGRSTVSQEAGKLARQALRMPVQTRKFKFTGPKTAGFVTVSTKAAGTLFAASTLTKVGGLIARQMSNKAAINIGIREYAKQGDTEMVLILMNLKRAGNQGKVASDIWATRSWEDIRSLKRDADKFGIDFDELIMEAAVEPKYLRGGLGAGGQPTLGSYAVSNPNLTALNPRYVSDPAVSSLHSRAQQMWGHMGKRGNQALPYSTPLQELKDEFYVMRALKGDVARNLNVVKDNHIFDVSIGGVGVDSNLRGNIFSRRKYQTPSSIKAAIIAGEVSLDEIFTKYESIRKAFEIDAQVLEALKGEGKAVGTIQERIANSPQLAEELKNGVSLTTVDGSVMQNRFMGNVLTEPNVGGSIESQIEKIGRELLGDEYVEMFSKSASDALSRYVNMWQSRIRSQYVVDYANQLGITVDGVDNAAFGSASKEIASKIAHEEAVRVAMIVGETVRKGRKGVGATRKVGKPLMDQLLGPDGFIASVTRRAQKVAQYDDFAKRPRKGSGTVVEGLEIPAGKPMSVAHQQIAADAGVTPLAYSKDRQAYDMVVNQIQTAEDKIETLEEIFALVNPLNNPDGRNTLYKARREMLNLSVDALSLLQEPLTVGKSVRGQAREALTRSQYKGFGSATDRAAQLKTYEEAVEFLVELADEVKLLSEFRDEIAAFIRQMEAPINPITGKPESLDLPFIWLYDQVARIDEGISVSKRWLEDAASRYTRNVIETDATTIMADALYDLSMRGLAGHYRWATPMGGVTLPLRSGPKPLWEHGGRYQNVVSIGLEEYDPRWFRSQKESWTGHAEPVPITKGDFVYRDMHGYNPRYTHVDELKSSFWEKLRFSDKAAVDKNGKPLIAAQGRPTQLDEWIQDPNTGKYRLPNAKELEEINARKGIVGRGIPYEGRPVVISVDPESDIGRAILQRQREAMDTSPSAKAREERIFGEQGLWQDDEMISFLSRHGVDTGTVDVPPQQLLGEQSIVPIDAPIQRGATPYQGTRASDQMVAMYGVQEEAAVGYAKGRPKFTTDPTPSDKRELFDVPSYATTRDPKTGKVLHDIPEYPNPITTVREAAVQTGDKKAVTWAAYIAELEEIKKLLNDDVLFYSFYGAIESLPDAARLLDDVGQRSASIRIKDLLDDKSVKEFIKEGNISISTERTTVTEFINELEKRLEFYRRGLLPVDDLEAARNFPDFPRSHIAIQEKIAELRAFKDAQEGIITNYHQRLNGVIEDFTRKRDAALADLAAKQGEMDDVIAAIDSKNLSTKILVDNLELELAELRQSLITKERLSAIDNQTEAINEIRKVRNFSGFADAYGGAANDFILSMTPFKPALERITPPTLLGKETAGTVQGATKRALANQSLVGVQITDDKILAYAEAFQAVARTQDPDTYSWFARNYMPLVNYWKAWAVTTTGFFMRNGLGGVWINSAINDVPMHYHVRVNEIRKIARESGRTQDVLEGIDHLVAAGKPVKIRKQWAAAAGGETVTIDELKAFKAWNEAGIGGSGQVSMEIKSSVDEFATWKSSNRPWKQKSWDKESRSFIPNDNEYMVQRGNMRPWTPEFKPISWVRGRNQDVEYMLRGAMAHNMMMGGYSIDDAMESVIKFHFDYSDLTKAERKIKGVIPFWTWQKNIVPVLIESIGKNPKQWGRLAQVKKELELHSPMENVVPDYFAENMGIRLPFKTAAGRVYWMPDLPFRDLTKWTKDMDSSSDLMGIPQNFWRVAKESAFPPIKLPFEMWAGKQSFADIPLTGRFQQAPKWAEIPFLKQALLTTGIADKGLDGRLVMRDKHIYMFDQILPIFGRMRRLYPNERRKQSAFATTFINTFFGAGIRVNSSMEQMSQIAKQTRLLEESQRDLRDKYFRRV